MFAYVAENAEFCYLNDRKGGKLVRVYVILFIVDMYGTAEQILNSIRENLAMLAN